VAAATFDAIADYVGADRRSVGFDGRTLTITRPPSLGGGIHPIEAVDGRYRIGWGLPRHRVDASHCDRVAGDR
jgi:hypothetical protein